MPQLFFDEPLSEALCKAVGDIFPGSLHIRLLGQGGAADATVWDLARQHGCLVISKDEDFVDRWLLDQAPVALIWIRRGNCSNRALLVWLEPLWLDTLKRLEQGERFIELRE